MSGSTCGEPHPEHGTPCSAPDAPHQWHSAVLLVPGSPPQGLDWLNEEYANAGAARRPRTRGEREAHKAEIRERIRSAEGGPAPEMTVAWAERKAEWLRQAKRVLHTFCQQHEGDFTTAEDVWPLLDSPGEMRAFVVPVRHALRSRWMTEVGARRLSGLYTTADGVQFQMNKLVPVYRSRIVLPKELRG